MLRGDSRQRKQKYANNWNRAEACDDNSPAIFIFLAQAVIVVLAVSLEIGLLVA